MLQRRVYNFKIYQQHLWIILKIKSVIGSVIFGQFLSVLGIEPERDLPIKSKYAANHANKNYY